MARPKGSKNKPKDKEKSAEEAVMQGLERGSIPTIADAIAMSTATDSEMQSLERLPGDRWDGAKLLERIVGEGKDEVDVPIPLQDYQARSERMAHATEQLLDILPREKATVLATFRERKAKLEEECDKLRKEVQHHTEKRIVDLEQVADYENGVMLWRTKEGKHVLDHRTRPLSVDERQTALPLGERTRKNPPKAEDANPIVLDPNQDPNGPPAFSKAWTKIPELPGLMCLPGDREAYRLAFQRAIALKLKETEGKDDQLTGDEVSNVMEIVQLDLAKDSSRLRAEVAAAATSADGGTNPVVRTYVEDDDNPGHCKGCKADIFEHEEQRCPKPALSLVQ